VKELDGKKPQALAWGFLFVIALQSDTTKASKALTPNSSRIALSPQVQLSDIRCEVAISCSVLVYRPSVSTIAF
jgi:hypothetical protein